MNQLLSGTAAGIFLATSVFISFHLVKETTTSERETLTEENAQRILIEDGYHVLTNHEWENYQTDLQTLKRLKSTNTQNNKDEMVLTSIQLSIKPGMSSNEIINRLKELNIVEDAAAFSTYLEERDLTKKIQTGTYTVYQKMDYAALAAVLTKGR